MMREDFILCDSDYETKVDGILIKISENAMNEEAVTYANRVFELFISKKSEIIDYILNDTVFDFYEGTYTKDEIVKRLNEPDITILNDKCGILTWLNHELDEHIIEVEFGHDMQLFNVNIDG